MERRSFLKASGAALAIPAMEAFSSDEARSESSPENRESIIGMLEPILEAYCKERKDFGRNAYIIVEEVHEALPEAIRGSLASPQDLQLSPNELAAIAKEPGPPEKRQQIENLLRAAEYMYQLKFILLEYDIFIDVSFVRGTIAVWEVEDSSYDIEGFHKLFTEEGYESPESIDFKEGTEQRFGSNGYTSAFGKTAGGKVAIIFPSSIRESQAQWQGMKMKELDEDTFIKAALINELAHLYEAKNFPKMSQMGTVDARGLQEAFSDYFTFKAFDGLELFELAMSHANVDSEFYTISQMLIMQAVSEYFGVRAPQSEMGMNHFVSEMERIITMAQRTPAILAGFKQILLKQYEEFVFPHMEKMENEGGMGLTTKIIGLGAVAYGVKKFVDFQLMRGKKKNLQKKKK